jgi:hypothetical protein
MVVRLERRGIGAGVSAVYANRDETQGADKAKNISYARLVDSRGIRLKQSSRAVRLDPSAHTNVASRLVDVISVRTQRQDKDRQQCSASGECQALSISTLRRVKEQRAFSSGVTSPRR